MLIKNKGFVKRENNEGDEPSCTMYVYMEISQ
jgi:hypothetical protein